MSKFYLENSKKFSQWDCLGELKTRKLSFDLSVNVNPSSLMKNISNRLKCAKMNEILDESKTKTLSIEVEIQNKENFFDFGNEKNREKIKSIMTVLESFGISTKNFRCFHSKSDKNKINVFVNWRD